MKIRAQVPRFRFYRIIRFLVHLFSLRIMLVGGLCLPMLLRYLKRFYAWDSSIIHQLFVGSTAFLILSLGRPSTPMDDFVYWKFIRDGLFATRSAYALLLNQQVAFSPVSIGLPTQWWKRFWGYKSCHIGKFLGGSCFTMSYQ